MNETFTVFTKALKNPDLYALLESIEDTEYTPSGALDVLFSAYGAGFWPPPGPSEASAMGEQAGDILPVVRNKPTAPWQVVVVPQKEHFLLQGYGDSLEQPVREETIEFPES